MEKKVRIELSLDELNVYLKLYSFTPSSINEIFNEN